MEPSGWRVDDEAAADEVDEAEAAVTMLADIDADIDALEEVAEEVDLLAFEVEDFVMLAKLVEDTKMADEELETFSTETDAESVTDEETEELDLVEVAAGEERGEPKPLLKVGTGALEPDEYIELLAAGEEWGPADPLLADGEGALDPDDDSEVEVPAAERKVVKLDIEEDGVFNPLLWPEEDEEAEEDEEDEEDTEDEEDRVALTLGDVEVADVVTPDVKSSSVIDEVGIEIGPALGILVPEEAERRIDTAEDTDRLAEDDMIIDDEATIDEAIDEDGLRVELIPVEFAIPLRDVEDGASTAGSVG